MFIYANLSYIPLDSQVSRFIRYRVALFVENRKKKSDFPQKHS